MASELTFDSCTGEDFLDFRLLFFLSFLTSLLDLRLRSPPSLLDFDFTSSFSVLCRRRFRFRSRLLSLSLLLLHRCHWQGQAVSRQP